MTAKKEKTSDDHSSESTVVTSIEKLQEEPDQKAYILFLSGPLQGKLFCLDVGETAVGRADDVDISIHDARISRRHFKLIYEEGKAVIEDLGSTNGTFVNGKRITRHALESGDKIQISSVTVIKFAYGDKGERMFHDEFYHMANFDAVTGIYNKRFFVERIKEEFSHARRTNVPLSLLMIDLDYFKKTNDTYGHLAGDFALCNVARHIKATIRGEDILARYGGEEFSVILRGIDQAGAIQLAERIRKIVEQQTTDFEGKAIVVTISIGIATFAQENFQDSQELIASADQFLYASKQRGRNCVSAPDYTTRP